MVVPVGIRLSDLRRANPADATLHNLLAVLSDKLELCARLPVLEYEASNEGHEGCAVAFRRLAEVERRSLDDMLDCLHQHLGQGRGGAGVPAGGAR